MIPTDRQRSRHTARIIDYSVGDVWVGATDTGAVARAGRAADMFAAVMDVSPRKPPVIRVGETHSKLTDL